MTSAPASAIFTLSEIHQAAKELLETHPDSVITWRLLRGAGRPPDDLQRKSQRHSRIRPMGTPAEQAQLPNGSWGPLYTGYQAETVFHTTDVAIDRAFALGLIQVKVHGTRRQYILEVLNGNAHVTDRMKSIKPGLWE
jgi:hypothetical protein